MKRKELIKKYLKFFQSKNHKKIPTSSLVPNLGSHDTGVLFTTAGMHPLVPYLLGKKHPKGKRLTSVQKCLRTQDIEEVGDTYHHTFFEMLGNWSLGDYSKEKSIKYSFEFLTKKLNIPIKKIAITCFKGDKSNSIPKDTKASKIWESLGISKERIIFLGKKENWWGPAGKTGPCGPDTEIFYWKPNDIEPPKKFNPDDKRWVEIWNNVFMQYNKNKQRKYETAKQKNVDTGMGVERTTAILNGIEDDYLGQTFKPIIKKIEKISGKKYQNKSKEMRIIADHIKAAVFIMADKIKPSNTKQGYVLRRLIRRAIRYTKLLNMEKGCIEKISDPIFNIYNDYSNLKKSKKHIIKELKKEEKRFNKTLEKGLNVFKRMIENKSKNKLSGKESFLLFQSYGFPLEMTKELAKEKGIKIDEKGFKKEQKKHKKLSKTASKGTFKSGLSNKSEQTKKLHTATHLLLQALKEVLNNKNIEQRGSNINSKRLRLDFSFSRKLTKEELKKVENLVNKQIQKKLPVTKKEMSPQKAKQQGACGIFNDKYGDIVSVYSIGDFSKEICLGPHVKNLSELGKFKIKKEKSSSSGVRRIKAILK